MRVELFSERWLLPCAAIASALTSVGVCAQTPAAVLDAHELPVLFSWVTVANSGLDMPGSTRKFNSFNQPSVSADGLVVMRARSRGGQGAGEPLRGIYARQFGRQTGSLAAWFDTLTEVPAPNNTLYSGQPGTFTEFPAFPRIGIANSTVATRGQSKPVWTYVMPDGSESRAGTSGVYAMRLGERVTGAAQLGAVPEFTHFSVPGAPLGTKFDQFPGSPAVADANVVVFKGNYTDAVSKTGIFFRSFNPSGKQSNIQVVASSDTLIPGQPVLGIRFGSTAPPSASPKDVVFLGLDNEEAPTLGGIYRAPLASNPPLQALVSIGGQVPGEQPGVTFNRLGEALSYDGRFVAFWGAWGSAARSVTLPCPAEGQAAVIAFCHATYPAGWVVQVPVNQGFFVHDVQTRRTHVAARTGGEFVDFLYWNFSGRPPGVTESEAEDFEPPRWRSAAFVATFGKGSKAQVAFKGRKPTVPVTDGLYLTRAPSSPSVIRTVVETHSAANLIDSEAPSGASVISVGLERDGLRDGWLAITASMLDTVNSQSWAGVYLTRTAK